MDGTQKKFTYIIVLILIGLALLAVGELYLIAKVSASPQSISSGPVGLAPSMTGGTVATSTQGAAPIVKTALMSINGIVRSVENSSFTMSPPGAPSSVTLTVNLMGANTVFLKGGAAKDSTTQAADWDAFYKNMALLDQDTQKNEFALAHLIPPQPFVTSAGAYSDVKPGETVIIYAQRKGATTFDASEVIVSPPTVSSAGLQ